MAKKPVCIEEGFVNAAEESDIKKMVASKVDRLRAETDKLVRKMVQMTGEVGWMGALRRLAFELDCHIAKAALKDAGISYGVVTIDNTRILASVRFGDRLADLVDSSSTFLPHILRIDRFKEWSVYKMADDLDRISELLNLDVEDFNSFKEFVETWEPRFLDYLEFNCDPLRKRAKALEGLVIGC